MRAEPRTRLGGVLLAVVLLAAACGGDNTTDEPEDDAATEAVPEVAGSNDDRTTTSTSEATDQTDATAEPAPEPEPQPEPVPLGDRFPWCGEMQAVLDRQAQAQARADAAGVTHEATWNAWNAATDELDKAEALTALEAAEQASEDAGDALTAANREAARLLQPDYRPNPDTLAIALDRARAEHRPNADSDVLELYELAHFTTGPASAEPAAAEPEPEEIAATEDPQTADPEPRNLEETLATVAVIQSEIDGLAWTAYDAAWEADEALSSLQAAVDARSAIDAHETLLDALKRADEADHARCVMLLTTGRSENELKGRTGSTPKRP